VGVFLTACTVLIIVGFAVISGLRQGDYTAYWVEFNESVQGLSKDGEVQYLGVPVGKVTDIWVTESKRAHVELLIDNEKVTLHRGVKAKLVSFNFATGTLAVSLAGGEPASGVLPANSEIPSEESFIGALSRSIGEVIEELKAIGEKVNSGLEGMQEGDIADVVAQTKSALEDVRGFVTDARATLADIREKIDAGLGDVQGVTEEVRELVENANGAVLAAKETIEVIKAKIEPLDLGTTEQVLRTSAEELMQRLKETTDNFNDATQVLLHQTANFEYDLRETLRALNDSLESVRDLSELLEQDPAALVRGHGTPRREP